MITDKDRERAWQLVHDYNWNRVEVMELIAMQIAAIRRLERKVKELEKPKPKKPRTYTKVEAVLSLHKGSL